MDKINKTVRSIQANLPLFIKQDVFTSTTALNKPLQISEVCSHFQSDPDRRDQRQAILMNFLLLFSLLLFTNIYDESILVFSLRSSSIITEFWPKSNSSSSSSTVTQSHKMFSFNIFCERITLSIRADGLHEWCWWIF